MSKIERERTLMRIAVSDIHDRHDPMMSTGPECPSVFDQHIGFGISCPFDRVAIEVTSDTKIDRLSAVRLWPSGHGCS